MVRDYADYPIANKDKSKWGFYFQSEILNGRVAMIAFIFILLVEIATKQTLLNLLSFF